jgi:hypothetical protein
MLPRLAFAGGIRRKAVVAECDDAITTAVIGDALSEHVFRQGRPAWEGHALSSIRAVALFVHRIGRPLE